MKCFDQIVVISLPNDVGRERMDILEPHLRDQGIEYMKFDATENENGVVGLLQTMKELFTILVEHGINNVLILEDDSEFVVNFNDFIDEIWPQVPKDYHCLFLACTLMSRPVRVSDNILRIGSSYCTNAIVYTLEAMKLILPALEKHPTQAYDITLMQGIQQEGKCYCTFPQMCYQREGYSSIEKRSMNWKSYQTQAFNTYTKGL
jgi:GR25 family glycosyltransferase involved in LPS biosynthesis